MGQLTSKQVLNLPMQENDASAETVREYFELLLLCLWDEKEGFSGKRPFGNGGWSLEVVAALVQGKAVKGSLDDEGYVETYDRAAVDKLVPKLITALCNGQ